jgi:hypothetical protein
MKEHTPPPHHGISLKPIAMFVLFVILEHYLVRWLSTPAAPPKAKPDPLVPIKRPDNHYFRYL